MTTGSEAPQVLIAGGGPTGLWLASELALARVRVVLLEKLAAPTGLSKALGLQSRTMEMLDHRGILDRFTAGNPAPPFLNFAVFPLDLRTLDFSHPHGIIIPQSRVEVLLELQLQDDATRIAKLMRAGRGVLVDLSSRPELRDVIDGWADRIEAISARCADRPADLDAMLIRPDGYMACVIRSSHGNSECALTLRGALEKWFGAAR